MYNNEIKIVDFGTSSFLKSKNKLFNIIGTVSYMAPEVIYGFYNEKCDIWSCGIVLFTLLSGKSPYG